MTDLMTTADLETELQQLEGWHLTDGAKALEKEYVFKGFNAAFGFMSRVAMAAERHDHHPEWSNVYNRVSLRWTTHSAGGVTQLDVKLARICDRFAASQ